MKCCTFFGHRDCPDSIKETLEKNIRELIETKNVRTFYIGNHGNFDFLITKILKKLSKEYDINYHIVLAYIPQQKSNHFLNDYENTIIPESIENVPKKFAIPFRNKWMIDKSDYVITHVIYSFGGASKFAEYAKQKKKIVINIIK